MTDHRSPPPRPQACLCRPYPSSQKGGTLIAEDVRDLKTHEQRLAAPDGYRPDQCPRCSARLHVHDLRVRSLLGDPERSTEVLRFRCADREHCGATWQILPAFLARHLWRTWGVVASAIGTPLSSPVPERTRRRWMTRLGAAARMLVAALTMATGDLAERLVAAVGLDARRIDLVRAFAAERPGEPRAPFVELAGWIHRLTPGVRLM